MALEAPPEFNGRHIMPIKQMCAVAGVALGRPGGRVAPYLEWQLSLKITRVMTAIREGRDPKVAIDVPLDDEKPLRPLKIKWFGS